jgi:hypothetical protein
MSTKTADYYAKLKFERKERDKKLYEISENLRSEWRTCPKARKKLVELMKIHQNSPAKQGKNYHHMYNKPEPNPHKLPNYYRGSCMDLKYLLDGSGHVHVYNEGGCWGSFLSKHRPTTLCVPIKSTSVDKDVIEWLINTPMLKKVLVNPDVKSVLANGFVIDTEQAYYSEWYVPAMFCRSISEQTAGTYFPQGFFDKIKNCSGFVKYWMYMANPVSLGNNFKEYVICLFPDVHGQCWQSNETRLGIKTLVEMPVQEIIAPENMRNKFYGRNEVHAAEWALKKKDEKSLYRVSMDVQGGRIDDDRIYCNSNKAYLKDIETAIEVLEAVEKEGV